MTEYEYRIWWEAKGRNGIVSNTTGPFASREQMAGWVNTMRRTGLPDLRVLQVDIRQVGEWTEPNGSRVGTIQNALNRGEIPDSRDDARCICASFLSADHDCPIHPRNQTKERA